MERHFTASLSGHRFSPFTIRTHKTYVWRMGWEVCCSCHSLTPIVPAVSRTNNIDSMLVFTLLLATWMLFRAVRTVKFGWSVSGFCDDWCCI